MLFRRNRLTSSKALATLTVSLSLVAALSLGCTPPDSSVGGAGSAGDIAIQKVAATQEALGAFQLLEKDGVEFHVARSAVGQFGGTFYDAGIGEGPKTFNYWVSKDGTSSAMAAKMTAGLVTDDPATGQPIPDLAKSVTVSDDRTLYTVTLRQGLKWSDGEPLTSRDVVFTWNDIVKAGMGNVSMRDNSMVDGQFPEVRALDERTIEFKTVKPFVPFMRRLGMAIAPAHVFEPMMAKAGQSHVKSAFNAFWGTSTANLHPEQFVSCGAWVLEGYDSAIQRVTFKRNPHFHMVNKEGRRLPYLDRYVTNFVSDMNNMALQFEQGKIDIYPVPGQFLSHVRQLKKPGFVLYNLGPSDTKTFVFFNQNIRNDEETHQPLVNPVRSKWFTNTKFRQAIDWAINRDDIVANILKGVAQPAFTAESPVSPFIHKELAKGHPRNLEKAKVLLKEAGFSYNEKKELVDDAGNRVEFELLTNSGNDARESIGVSLKQDLAEIGIQVNFKPIEFNVLSGMYDTGKWEASIMGLGGGSPLEPHDGANIWKSDSALHMFNNRRPDENGLVSLGDRLPWEKELDDLFDSGALTFDFDKRKQIYMRYQEVVSEQQPFIYLYSPLNIIAVHQRLHNVRPLPLGGTQYNIEEIWIEGAVQQSKEAPKNPA